MSLTIQKSTFSCAGSRVLMVWGLAPVHFAAVPVVEDDAPVALVQDDSPLHDAVAVGRAGLEPFDPHPVHASDATKSGDARS